MKIVRNHKLFEDFYDNVEQEVSSETEDIAVDGSYNFRIGLFVMFNKYRTQEENVENAKKIINRILSQMEYIDEIEKSGKPAIYMNIPNLNKNESFSFSLDDGTECQCFYVVNKFSQLNSLLIKLPVVMKPFDSMNRLFNVPFMVYKSAMKSMAYTNNRHLNKAKVNHISIELIEGCVDIYEESIESIFFSQMYCQSFFSSENLNNSNLSKIKDYIEKFYTGKDTINIETFKKYILSKK